MIEEFGFALGLPYTKEIGEGLFEIRAKGKKVLADLSFALLKTRRSLFSTPLSKSPRKFPRRN